MSGGFVCKEAIAAETEISFTIFNRKPVSVELVSAELVETDCAQVVEFEEPKLMQRGEFRRVVFRCWQFPRIIESEIKINYKSIRSELTYGDKGIIKLRR